MTCAAPEGTPPQRFNYLNTPLASQEPVTNANRTFTIFHSRVRSIPRSCPFQQSRFFLFTLSCCNECCKEDTFYDFPDIIAIKIGFVLYENSSLSSGVYKANHGIVLKPSDREVNEVVI
jgi:hypothetical protein